MKTKQTLNNFTKDQIELPNELIYYPLKKFQSVIATHDVQQKTRLLEDMRSARNFYKTILKEDHRAKNPGSFRYADAEARLERLQANGLELSKLIPKE